MQIDKNLIRIVGYTLENLQTQIASESYHSGAGCSCITCETRNKVAKILKEAKRFEKSVNNLKEDIEYELRKYI